MTSNHLENKSKKMARAKTLQKKSPKRKASGIKKIQNRLGKFFQKLAGKEIAIWISIWFVLMSLLMLFANNLRVSQAEDWWSQIHAAAGLESKSMPWISK